MARSSNFGALDYVLLGLLHDHPRHAYDITRIFAKPTDLGLLWHIKESHIYALLGKLEEERLLSGEIIPQQIRPPRRLLHLTEQGRQNFLVWRVTPVQRARAFRQDFLAKLYFAGLAGEPERDALIAAQTSACEDRLSQLQNLMEQARQATDFNRDVLSFRMSQMQAILTWLASLSSTSIAPSHT